MRVLCTLGEIQDELGMKKADLERELGMDSRTVDKLIADSPDDPWRLDRDMLHRYFLFARAHGFEPFRVEPHAIWERFQDSQATIFRGPKKADVPVENHLVKYFERLRCEVNTSTTPEGIEEAMRERNCVVIGSPKGNKASEIALALLWDAKPFQGDSKNREKIPICFLGMDAEHAGSSALLQESSRHGFDIKIPGSEQRGYLKVDWLSPDKFGPYRGSGQDAAVLVVCNRPMGAEKDVTTIVIAGYTGLATLVAAQEATSPKIPDLKAGRPGEPCFAVMKFRYKKRRQQNQSPADNLRVVEEGSTVWAPPWSSVFQ